MERRPGQATRALAGPVFLVDDSIAAVGGLSPLTASRRGAVPPKIRCVLPAPDFVMQLLRDCTP
jgi:hypothetical protein